MIKQGIVISLSDSNRHYLVAERLDDMGQGQGGWLCIEMDALREKGIDNISAFDCWRVSDKYIEMQMKRGVITIPILINITKKK